MRRLAAGRSGHVEDERLGGLEPKHLRRQHRRGILNIVEPHPVFQRAAECLAAVRDLPPGRAERYRLHIPAIPCGPRAACFFEADLERVDAEGGGKGAFDGVRELLELGRREQMAIALKALVDHSVENRQARGIWPDTSNPRLRYR